MERSTMNTMQEDTIDLLALAKELWKNLVKEDPAYFDKALKLG